MSPSPARGDTKDPRPKPPVLSTAISQIPARPSGQIKVRTISGLPARNAQSLLPIQSLTGTGSRVPAPPQTHPFDPLLLEMASTFHASSSNYPPPPTYSQETTDSAMNGINHSQSALNSFDGRQSIGSTPTPTPPTSRHQPNGPYNMSNYPPMNGAYSQIGTPRKMAQQQYYPPGQKPEIYTV